MAATGKLGTADSLLANVQLAFAAANAAPPAITTQDGRLGWQLGNTALGINGVIGPLVIHPSAESVLALAQTADPDPTFAAHPSRDWVLGGHDSQLGGMEPAFAGAEDAPPAVSGQTGRLGTAPGKLALGLSGVVSAHVYNMTAQSVLAIAQVADPAPAFAPHQSHHWVLGGQDSYLGGMELAYAGAPIARPLTGSLTGKLGTADSFLGGVRLALGLEEGESSGAIVLADAESVLSLTSAASAAIARPVAAESTISLTVAAGRNNLLSAAAESTLSLTVQAGRNNLLDASAESALSPDQAAGFAVAWAVAASSEVALSDAAGRNDLLTAAAESVLSLDEAAGCAAVRSLAAETVLALTDAAANTGRTIYTIGAVSTLGLMGTAAFAAVRVVAASDVLDLMDTAGRNSFPAVSAESTIVLTSAAGRNNLPNLSAESVVSLTSEAGRNSFPAVSAESTISLTSLAGRNNFLAASAESILSLTSEAGRNTFLVAAATSELALTDEAAGIHVVGHRGDCYDWLELYDWATASVVRSLSAQNTINLAQAERTARPWYLSAESPLQTVMEGYDPATDTFYPIYEGLRDSAKTARPLTAAAHQSIPLAQSASAVRVKPTAIDVSAESVLELLGEVRLSPNPSAGDWLVLGQTAAVEKCKLVRSRLNLTQEAAVLVSLPRGAASALTMTQAATFYKVFPGVLQQYHPFIGEGAPGSPTPPPVMIGGI